MPTLQLTDEECGQLMNRLITSDPLMMKIAGQLREQQVPTPSPVVKPKADGKEARHE